MQNLQAWTKLHPKPVSKAGECKLIKFFSLAITRSNSPLFLYAVFNGIKPLWYEATFPKLISFLKYQRIVWIACCFTVFMIVKTVCQNISKTSHRICLNFAIMKAIMAGTYSLKRFLQKNSWYRETQRYIKSVMVSLRCHGDSNCNKIRIIRYFHLYIIQLW